MMRTYTMRLKATKGQQEKLSDLLEHLCVLYNSALEERKKSWEDSKIAVNYGNLQERPIICALCPNAARESRGTS
jgi:hypothetical protein